MGCRVIYPSGKIIEFVDAQYNKWLDDEFIELLDKDKKHVARISKATGLTFVHPKVKIKEVKLNENQD
jgi:hypothetical protein